VVDGPLARFAWLSTPVCPYTAWTCFSSGFEVRRITAFRAFASGLTTFFTPSRTGDEVIPRTFE
jgi:hypothetical protein